MEDSVAPRRKMIPRHAIELFHWQKVLRLPTSLMGCPKLREVWLHDYAQLMVMEASSILAPFFSIALYRLCKPIAAWHGHRWRFLKALPIQSGRKKGLFSNSPGRYYWSLPEGYAPLSTIIMMAPRAVTGRFAIALRIQGDTMIGGGVEGSFIASFMQFCPLERKMVKLTMIARIVDGLPLAEGLDDGRDIPDADFYKQQVKSLFKNLATGHNEPSRMSIETGPYMFHYVIEGRVCYLTMCDRSYPKKLAFQYLEDLKNEFERVNGSQIETAARPYAFIKFDTFIQKTKKLYQDTRTQRNVAKLNDELYEVHQIMTRNVQEVLGVGEKLDQVSQMSSRLTSESRVYADKARDLNRQALIRKWAPVAVVLGVVFLLFWVRKKLW
nr:25.3 kDa vesicle transport protein [Ipomoea batatas]